MNVNNVMNTICNSFFQIECISNTKDEKILQIRIDEAVTEIFEKDLQISALRLVKPSVKKTYLTYLKTRTIDDELIIKATATVYRELRNKRCSLYVVKLLFI